MFRKLDLFPSSGEEKETPTLLVSPTHRPHSAPQKQYFSASDTHFCYRLSEPQGLVSLEGLVKLKNSFTSSGLELTTFRLVTQCLNHYATVMWFLFISHYISCKNTSITCR
jgi:hypothetical protein